jgi:AraC-like DNA-binding protein
VIGETQSPVQLFPDINRPGYEHVGRLSGFGWPNLLAFWKSVSLSFTQPVVPFAVVIPVVGSVRAAVDRRHLEIPGGTYLAIPPGCELCISELVATGSGRTPELLIAFCNPTFIRNVWQSDEERFHPLVRVYHEDHISRTLITALREYRRAPVDAVGDEEIEDLLYGVIRTFAERDQEDRKRWQDLSVRDDADRVHLFEQLSRARDLAHSAFDRPLRVEELAAEAGLSKYHFIRLFDRAFHITPYRYLHQIRLEHARRRLEEGFRDIGALCHECGFASLGSFSWAFKRRYGRSPRNFAILEKSG